MMKSSRLSLWMPLNLCVLVVVLSHRVLPISIYLPRKNQWIQTIPTAVPKHSLHLDRTSRVLACPSNVLEKHNGGVEYVAFSPDGARIVSGSWDKTIWVWNAETGEVVGGLHPFTFSPDGTHIISGSWDQTIRVWNTATGEVREPFRAHTGGSHLLQWHTHCLRVL